MPRVQRVLLGLPPIWLGGLEKFPADLGLDPQDLERLRLFRKRLLREREDSVLAPIPHRDPPIKEGQDPVRVRELWEDLRQDALTLRSPSPLCDSAESLAYQCLSSDEIARNQAGDPLSPHRGDWAEPFGPDRAPELLDLPFNDARAVCP